MTIAIELEVAIIAVENGAENPPSSTIAGIKTAPSAATVAGPEPEIAPKKQATITETFKIYDVEEGKVVHSEVVDTNGSGHGALAGVLKALNADVLICGGIGGGAQTALAAAGIKLFGGVSGDADEAVEAFINETLDYNPDVKCSHHEHSHGEGHTCGEHGCGSHSCH